MLILKKIEIEAFRSFKDFQTIELPQKGLFLVKGLNKDTGGSSNSGKSSFNLAIAYGLGFSPYPSTVLQSFLTDNKMQVTQHLMLNNKSLVIGRGKNTFINYDGSVLNGATALNNRLKELIDINSDTFQALCYRAQSTRSKFLEMGDTEKKEFLSNLLQLNEIESSIDNSKNTLISLHNIYDKFLFDLKVTEHNLQELNKEIQNIDSISLQNYINKYNSNIKSNNLQIKSYKDQLLSLNQQNIESHSLNKEFYNNQLNEINLKIKNLNNELFNLELKIANLQNQLHHNRICNLKINEVNQKIDALNDTKCPTCQQTWVQPDLKYRLILENENLNKQIIQDINNLIDIVNNERIIIKNQILQLNSEKDTISKQFFDSQTANREAEAALNTQKASINLLINNLEKDNTIYNFEIKNINGQLENLKNKITTRDNLLIEFNCIKEQFNKNNILINKHQDFIEMMGKEGFLGNIFDEILQEISIETNNILKYIPNCSRITIKFVSDKTTLKGTTNRAITPIVMKSGVEIPLKAGLSGGMLTAVELAVDFGLSTVISRRTGKDIGWLILDESFDGLGIVEKEACTEILKRQAQDKLILVVDHSTEFKEIFDGCINIELQNEVSRIVNLTMN